MKSIFIFCFLTFSVSPTLWAASVTLAWDANPQSDKVTGYKIYVGEASRSYSKNYDAGNFLKFQVTKLVPTKKYFFAATAYNAALLESDFSIELSYTPPMPPLMLKIDRTKLTANVFAGGSFEIQTSSDLKVWSIFQIIHPIEDVYSMPLPLGMGPNLFFRLKFAGLSAPSSSKSLQKLLVKAPPFPPMPEPPKLTFLKKMKLFFRYRPGHHVDERKGAERLMEK